MSNQFRGDWFENGIYRMEREIHVNLKENWASMEIKQSQSSRKVMRGALNYGHLDHSHRPVQFEELEMLKSLD